MFQSGTHLNRPLTPTMYPVRVRVCLQLKVQDLGGYYASVKFSGDRDHISG